MVLSVRVVACCTCNTHLAEQLLVVSHPKATLADQICNAPLYTNAMSIKLPARLLTTVGGLSTIATTSCWLADEQVLLQGMQSHWHHLPAD